MKENKKPVIIAMTGKGGVGKTSVSAAIVRLLVEHYPDKKILAIDADPAVGLASVLHVEVTKTIDQIRKDIVAMVETGVSSAVKLKGEVKYHLYDAFSQGSGFTFLAIGRPEAAGCYCKVNAYLKEMITLLSDQFDYVVIDGEAGIEQINRRVMEEVSHLLLVTDASKKGCQVVETIYQLAGDLVHFEQAGVIANRIPSMEMAAMMDLGSLPLVSVILNDQALALCDLKGDNVMDLPGDCNIIKGAEDALVRLGIL